MIGGLLIVDKPPQRTSADVVRRVKWLWKCKTGHLGTLDPFATGVLPICIGEGTKLAQFLSATDKAYTATIRLGRQTATGDLTGRVTGSAPVLGISDAQLAAVASAFIGRRLQRPPMYSAVKQNGTPLYVLARRGVEVPRAEREVRIDSLELWRELPDLLGLRVSASKGTYIRVLAEEIAVALGTIGHLESLRRIRFGIFGIDEAVSFDNLTGEATGLIGLRQALRDVPEVHLDAAAAARARQGFEPLLRELAPGLAADCVKLVDPCGLLAAVIAVEPSGRWRFARVFAAAQQAAAP